MTLEMKLDEAFEEGKKIGFKIGKRRVLILELLEEYGSISQELKEKIMAEEDLDTLLRWLKLAAGVNSIEQFTERMYAQGKEKLE